MGRLCSVLCAPHDHDHDHDPTGSGDFAIPLLAWPRPDLALLPRWACAATATAPATGGQAKGGAERRNAVSDTGGQFWSHVLRVRQVLDCTGTGYSDLHDQLQAHGRLNITTQSNRSLLLRCQPLPPLRSRVSGSLTAARHSPGRNDRPSSST
jgi:hypothetical protein